MQHSFQVAELKDPVSAPALLTHRMLDRKDAASHRAKEAARQNRQHANCHSSRTLFTGVAYTTEEDRVEDGGEEVKHDGA